MGSLRTTLSLLLVGVLVCLPAAQVAPPAFADRLADAIGVNIHLHHTDTPYGNFDLVQSRLGELGVRHVRDGLVATTWQPYYDRHNALGAMGIKGMFIAAADVSDDALRGYPARMAQSFEAYEAPNEYDTSGVAAWTSSLRQSLVQLHALKSVTGLGSYPLYGPSLTSVDSYAALGDVSAYFDAANLHNYMQGRYPGTPGWGDGGYGSIDWNISLARRYAPGKPIVTTETGYWDDPGVPESVPATIVGRYMPRLLLEQFRKGIARTYIYELIDDPASGVAARSGYGLLRTDGSPKPAFNAVAGLLRVFSDPGAAPPATSFTYTTSGGDANFRHMPFQKRDGTILIAMWVEAPSFDLGSRQVVPVAPQAVRIGAPTGYPLFKAYRWRDDGTVAEDTSNAGQSSVSVDVTDTLTVLQFGAPRRAVPRAPVNLQIVK